MIIAGNLQGNDMKSTYIHIYIYINIHMIQLMVDNYHLNIDDLWFSDRNHRLLPLTITVDRSIESLCQLMFFFGRFHGIPMAFPLLDCQRVTYLINFYQ